MSFLMFLLVYILCGLTAVGIFLFIWVMAYKIYLAYENKLFMKSETASTIFNSELSAEQQEVDFIYQFLRYLENQPTFHFYPHKNEMGRHLYKTNKADMMKYFDLNVADYIPAYFLTFVAWPASFLWLIVPIVYLIIRFFKWFGKSDTYVHRFIRNGIKTTLN